MADNRSATSAIIEASLRGGRLTNVLSRAADRISNMGYIQIDGGDYEIRNTAPNREGVAAIFGNEAADSLEYTRSALGITYDTPPTVIVIENFGSKYGTQSLGFDRSFEGNRLDRPTEVIEQTREGAAHNRSAELEKVRANIEAYMGEGVVRGIQTNSRGQIEILLDTNAKTANQAIKAITSGDKALKPYSFKAEAQTSVPQAKEQTKESAGNMDEMLTESDKQKPSPTEDLVDNAEMAETLAPKPAAPREYYSTEADAQPLMDKIKNNQLRNPGRHSEISRIHFENGAVKLDIKGADGKTHTVTPSNAELVSLAEGIPTTEAMPWAAERAGLNAQPTQPETPKTKLETLMDGGEVENPKPTTQELADKINAARTIGHLQAVVENGSIYLNDLVTGDQLTPDNDILRQLSEGRHITDVIPLDAEFMGIEAPVKQNIPPQRAEYNMGNYDDISLAANSNGIKPFPVGGGYELSAQPKSVWLNYVKKDITGEYSGWKFHLSVEPSHDGSNQQEVAKFLMENGVKEFKMVAKHGVSYIADPEFEQTGKTLTVYDHGENWKEILPKLEDHLKQRGISPGNAVKNDRLITGSEYVHYRNDRTETGEYNPAIGNPEQGYNPNGNPDPFESIDLGRSAEAPNAPSNTRTATSPDNYITSAEEANFVISKMEQARPEGVSNIRYDRVERKIIMTVMGAKEGRTEVYPTRSEAEAIANGKPVAVAMPDTHVLDTTEKTPTPSTNKPSLEGTYRNTPGMRPSHHMGGMDMPQGMAPSPADMAASEARVAASGGMQTVELGGANSEARTTTANAPTELATAKNSANLPGKAVQGAGAVGAVNDTRIALKSFEERNYVQGTVASLGAITGYADMVTDFAAASKYAKYVPKWTGPASMIAGPVIEGFANAAREGQLAAENGGSAFDIAVTTAKGAEQGVTVGAVNVVTGGLFGNMNTPIDTGQAYLADNGFGWVNNTPTTIKYGAQFVTGLATDESARGEYYNSISSVNLTNKISDAYLVGEKAKNFTAPDVNYRREAILNKNEAGIPIPPQLINYGKLNDLAANYSYGTGRLELSNNPEMAKYGVTRAGDPEFLREALAQERTKVLREVNEISANPIAAAWDSIKGGVTSYEASERGMKLTTLNSMEQELAAYEKAMGRHVEDSREAATRVIEDKYGIENPTSQQVNNYLYMSTVDTSQDIYEVLSSENLVYDESRENPEEAFSVLTEQETFVAETSMIKDGLNVSVLSDGGDTISVTGIENQLNQITSEIEALGIDVSGSPAAAPLKPETLTSAEIEGQLDDIMREVDALGLDSNSGEIGFRKPTVHQLENASDNITAEQEGVEVAANGEPAIDDIPEIEPEMAAALKAAQESGIARQLANNGLEQQEGLDSNPISNRNYSSATIAI